MKKDAKKFAFVGTSCVYKTTIVEHYRQKFIGNTNFVIVEEAARVFFSTHNIANEKRFLFPAQSRIQRFALKSEKKAHASGAEVILCDRSVIDAVAYVLAQGDIKGAQKLLKKVKDWLSTYTMFFLLGPQGVPFDRDSVRQENENERMILHEGFINFFTSQRLPYILLDGSLKKRIKNIDKILTQHI